VGARPAERQVLLALADEFMRCGEGHGMAEAADEHGGAVREVVADGVGERYEPGLSGHGHQLPRMISLPVRVASSMASVTSSVRRASRGVVEGIARPSETWSSQE